MPLPRVTTVGRLGAATRIAFGNYYITHDHDGWTVFDDRNPDGRARLTDALAFHEAVEYAHQVWEDESYGQGRAKPERGMSTRDRAIVRERFSDGATEADLGAKYGLMREKIRQICEKARALCQACKCRPPVHEPPCPIADPLETSLLAGTGRGSE